jgi:hypothetical protein
MNLHTLMLLTLCALSFPLAALAADERPPLRLRNGEMGRYCETIT